MNNETLHNRIRALCEKTKEVAEAAGLELDWYCLDLVRPEVNGKCTIRLSYAYRAPATSAAPSLDRLSDEAPMLLTKVQRKSPNSGRVHFESRISVWDQPSALQNGWELGADCVCRKSNEAP